MQSRNQEGIVQDCNKFLELAKHYLVQGRLGYRDSLLQVGETLHQYILAFLAAGIGMSSNLRVKKHRITREQAVTSAGSSLNITARYVNDIVAAWAVSDLLGVSGVGGLSWTVILKFQVFVERLQLDKAAADCDPTVVETWRLKPASEAVARQLFSRAVASDWGHKEARSEIKKLISTSVWVCKESTDDVLPVLSDITYSHREIFSSTEDQNKSGPVLLSSAKVANPIDLAESCLQAIKDCRDPRLAANRLRDLLGDFLSTSRITLADNL